MGWDTEPAVCSNISGGDIACRKLCVKICYPMSVSLVSCDAVSKLGYHCVCMVSPQLLGTAFTIKTAQNFSFKLMIIMR